MREADVAIRCFLQYLLSNYVPEFQWTKNYEMFLFIKVFEFVLVLTKTTSSVIMKIPDQDVSDIKLFGCFKTYLS